MLELKVDVHCRGKLSLYLGFFLWTLGSGVLVADGEVKVACWGRTLNFHFFVMMIVCWSVLARLGTWSVSWFMLMLMFMSFFVDDHYVCSSVAGLLCSRPMAHGDTNELKAPAAL